MKKKKWVIKSGMNPVVKCVDDNDILCHNVSVNKILEDIKS